MSNIIVIDHDEWMDSDSETLATDKTAEEADEEAGDCEGD